MTDYPIKAAAKAFTNEAFYLIQQNGPNKRYVASLQDKTKIKQFITDFINQINSDVQVKVCDLDNPDSPKEYYGAVDKTTLLQLLVKHEDVIFYHGYHDLVIRDPESRDYLAFEEHGLLFIYSNQDYTKTLQTYGAVYKPNEKLIYEYDHFHYCLPHGREKLTELINDLNLS